MRSIVVIFEDEYCDDLFHLLKTIRTKDLAMPSVAIHGPMSAKGTGGFAAELNRVLPLRFPRGPLPASAADIVICVADADRPANLIGKAAADAIAKREPSMGLSWVLELERLWLNDLQSKVRPGSSPQLATCCLRWSKESLLIAGLTTLREYCDDHRRSLFDDELTRCKPSNPQSITDESFVSTFRDPQGCIHRITMAGRDKPYKKGIDDAALLNEIRRNDPERACVAARCPDIVRLAKMIV